MNAQNPRQIALRVLQSRGKREFVEKLLDEALSRAVVSGVDRALCQELVFGVVRWQATLDWLIAQKSRARRHGSLLQNVLRLGLYQLFWLDRIPAHAAVHETVELARQRNLRVQSGFVNALLRSYSRNLDVTRRLLEDLKNTQPSLGHSHPEWLVARWEERWGKESAAVLMDWNNQRPRTFARVNTLKTRTDQLLQQWQREQVQYEPVRHDWLDDGLVFELKAHPSFRELPSFEQGLFYVQDPGTLLAVRKLGARPGESVLDLCAAPGGKLTCIAQEMQNQGRLVAHDTSAERLNLVKENCARLGVTCVRSALPSSLSLEPGGQFDRVLIDAPCSNTGVMRRRVELRWRVVADEIARLRKLQLDLLSQAARLVKRGGTMVYSTCSLEPEENRQVVDDFLLNHTSIHLEAERTLLPFSEKVDGAYVAVLKRE